MTSALAKALADRHTGIGCDQLILLEPSATADVKMRIWNHDGGEVQSCGNASRCVVALTGAKSLETGGGLVEGGTFGAEVEVSLPPPRFAWDEVPLNYPMDTARLPLAGAARTSDGAQRRQPAPGLLRRRRDQGDRHRGSGRASSMTRPSPERINVNVASVRDDGIHLRTWERGAGLTLACGTGACATAVAAIVQKKAARRSRCTMRGGELTISWAPGEPIRCAARRPMCSRARSTWSSSRMGRDDHPRLPAQLRRERGDARARRRRRDHRQQLRGHQRGGAPDPPGDPPRPSRGSDKRGSSSPAAPRSSIPDSFAAMPEVDEGHRSPEEPTNSTRARPLRTNGGGEISSDVMAAPAPVAAGFLAAGAQLRRGPDRLRPSLHLLLDLAGARAEPLAAL